MGVYNIDVGDRRKHEREERAVEFFCYIESQRFDSTSFDISAGGAFLRTDHELADGITALVAPKGERGADGAVLVGQVVRRQDDPVMGVAIKWVRCVSRKGIQSVFDLLAFYLGLFPASLPMPMPSVAHAETVAYDFQRRRFFIPRILSSASRSKKKDEAKRALAEAAESVVDQMMTYPGREPVEDPSKLAERSRATVDAAPVPEDSLPTVQEMPAAVLPMESSAEITGLLEDIRDERTGPVTRVIDRRDSWVPVTVGVEFFSCGIVRRGTVRFIGADGLYLISPRVPGDLDGAVVITYPVPVKGNPLSLFLVCKVVRIDRIVEGGVSGLELEIRSVRKEPVQGLFKRYVKYLYFRMFSEEG